MSHGRYGGKFKTLATAKTLDRLAKYINEFFYSTNYSVDPNTLEILNPMKKLPEKFFVAPHKGGFVFGVKE